MGLAPSEVYSLTVREFLACYRGYAKRMDISERQTWDRARWEAAAIIGPWLKTHKKLTELFPMPWDDGYTPECGEISEELYAERVAQAKELLAIIENNE